MHSTTMLTYKMAIVLRPQICDIISSCVYCTWELNSTQLNEHLWTQVLKHLNVHIYLVTISYREAVTFSETKQRYHKAWLNIVKEIIYTNTREFSFITKSFTCDYSRRSGNITLLLDIMIYTGAQVYHSALYNSIKCPTRFGRRVDKDGELHAVFLCRTNAWNGPCEPDKHAVERRRDAHRQSVVDDAEARNQLVWLVVTAVIHFQRAVSRRFNIHLQHVQRQPMSVDRPEQLRQKLIMQWLVNKSQM